MPNLYTRILLISAYAVISLEVAIPFIEHGSHVSNPMWQSVGMCFAVLNIVTLVALRPRPVLLVVSVLNLALAGATIVAGAVMVLKYGLSPISALDFPIAVGFFAGVVPLITAAFLYKSVSRLTMRSSGR